MSTHDICFHGEMRKISTIFGKKSTVSGAMFYRFHFHV